MPEIITAHPDIVRKVLESVEGIDCTSPLRPDILTECPNESFCKVTGKKSGGELCIYDVKDMDKSKQIRKVIKKHGNMLQRLGLI